MTTNPERLWAYTHRDGDIRAETSLDLAEQDRAEYGCDPAPVAEYIRADVAAEQTAAALRGEAHEVAALRAEVEALRSGEFVRAVTEERNAYREALEKVVALMAPTQVWEPWAAKEVAKAALAAKGVG